MLVNVRQLFCSISRICQCAVALGATHRKYHQKHDHHSRDSVTEPTYSPTTSLDDPPSPRHTARFSLCPLRLHQPIIDPGRSVASRSTVAQIKRQRFSKASSTKKACTHTHTHSNCRRKAEATACRGPQSLFLGLPSSMYRCVVRDVCK
jgi:hypothetical protein